MDASGVPVYGDFIQHELDAQDRRKDSFEQRALAIVTTSGALTTILFGLAAFATKPGKPFVLPNDAKPWLIAALALFFVSAIAALVTNLPLSYQAVIVGDIRKRLNEDPIRGADAAAEDVAFTRLKALESAKRKNAVKGWMLALAILAEAFAIGCVAVVVGLIL
jgi:hypothetical protein